MKVSTCFIIGTLCYMFLLHWVHATPQKVKEYHLKARYIDAFIDFIQWPSNIFANKNTSLKLCILGDNSFGKVLDILVDKHNERSTRQSNRRTVNYLQRGEDITGCHLVYISKSEESDVQQILSQVKNNPVLTISSLKNFAISGGMIQFYIRNNKVRFFINLRTLRREKLQPDANLLRIADLVNE